MKFNKAIGKVEKAMTNLDFFRRDGEKLPNVKEVVDKMKKVKVKIGVRKSYCFVLKMLSKH